MPIVFANYLPVKQLNRNFFHWGQFWLATFRLGLHLSVSGIWLLIMCVFFFVCFLLCLCVCVFLLVVHRAPHSAAELFSLEMRVLWTSGSVCVLSHIRKSTHLAGCGMIQGLWFVKGSFLFGMRVRLKYRKLTSDMDSILLIYLDRNHAHHVRLFCSM